MSAEAASNHPRRRTDPAAKKAIAYERDRRVHADEPHSFRKNRPKKKQMANQAYRSHVRQMLALDLRSAEQTGEDLPTEPVRRKRPTAVGGGWGTLPLGVPVQLRTSRRIHHEMWRFFGTQYDAAVHLASFAGLLGYMISKVKPVRSGTPWDKSLAWDLAALLELGPLPYGNRSPVVLTRVYYLWSAERQAAAAWLGAFLADEPSWETRIRDWVHYMTSEPAGPRR